LAYFGLFLLERKGKMLAGLLLVYLVIVAVQFWLLPLLPGSLATVFATVTYFLLVFPCIAVGVYIIATTSVSQPMAALERLGAPRSFSITLAVTLRFLPALRQDFRHIRDAKIDDDHIADIIQGRPTILPQEVRDVIFAKVRSYACDILDKLRELQVDLRANPAIFIGGGSILFRSFVEESPLVAHADFVTDPKANAIGYGMLATAQLRRMAPQNYG